MKSLFILMTLFWSMQVVAQMTTCVPNGSVGNVWVCSTKGATGAQGARGPAGVNGTNGTNGVDGKDGAPGPAGPQGATGPAGTNGQNGKDGKDGTNGTTGAQGVPGATGATGAQGPPGNTPTWTVDSTIDWTTVDPKTMALLTLGSDNATLHCTLRSGQPCKF